MTNRIWLLATMAVVCAMLLASDVLAQGGPGPRSSQNYSNDPGIYPNGGSSDRGPLHIAGAQQQPRQDAPRGTAPGQNPPAPPFQLSPQEQADLDNVLDMWEKKNGAIKTFKADFDRCQYDPVFFPKQPGEKNARPKQTSFGEIKYVAPDKGLLRETGGSTWTVNPTSRQLENKKLDALEHWACDGKTLYKVDYQQRTVDEIPIPPELQGKGITQGPLPFVFGAKAADLKARYYIRTTPPPAGAVNEYWLEIRPKYIRDAENYSKVEIILDANTMFPKAIQIDGTNGTDRDVYILTPKGGFDPFGPFRDDFSPSPFGFKHVKNTPNAPPAAQPGAPPASGQTERSTPGIYRR
jgi:TIGR03009 family protein